ncbi:MAG TPA: MFS transporter [Actinomycetota bacterium]|nr:MFS transporter [Actinomycetota bacterium]
MTAAKRERTATPPRTAVRRLAFGRAISVAGTFAAGTALTFTIYRETESTAWISATLLLTWAVIGFFSPLAGALGDRFDRRRVMIVSESASALCWLAMPLVADSPAGLLAVAFVSSVVEVPYYPASSAAIPNVAGEEHLSWANSLVAVGRYVGLTFGPIVGGLLVGVIGPEWVFVANGVSYLGSVALTWSVRADFADPERDEAEAEDYRGVLAGFRFVWADRVLRRLGLSFMVFIVGMATTLVADPVLADAFGMGALGFGLISAMWGAGTIAGAWVGRRITEESEGRWMLWCSILVALTGFGVALSPWFGLVLFWMFAFGATDGPTQVIEQNLLQRRSPDAVRSRVMGAWETLLHGSLVVALVAGAWIVSALGPKGAYAIGGVTGLIGAALLLPFLTWLPERKADVGTVEELEVARLVPFDAPE